MEGFSKYHDDVFGKYIAMSLELDPLEKLFHHVLELLLFWSSLSKLIILVPNILNKWFCETKQVFTAPPLSPVCVVEPVFICFYWL